MSSHAVAILGFLLNSSPPIQYGVLSITEPLTISSEGKPVSIPSGLHSLSIEYDANFFSKDVAIFKIGNQRIPIPLSKENFSKLKNGTDFSIDAKDLGQNFSIISKSTSEKLPATKRIENDNCTYCGYCHYMNVNAQLEYGYYTACQGSQKTEYEITTTRITKTFALKNKDKTIGNIKLPVESEHKKRIRDITDCE